MSGTGTVKELKNLSQNLDFRQQLSDQLKFKKVFSN